MNNQGIFVSILVPSLVVCQFFSRDDAKNAPRMGRRSDPSMVRDPRFNNFDSSNQSVSELEFSRDQDSLLRRAVVGKFLSALRGVRFQKKYSDGDQLYPWNLIGRIGDSTYDTDFVSDTHLEK